jgi:hypothetical protein
VEPEKSSATSSRLVLVNFCLYEKTGSTDALRSPLIQDFLGLVIPGFKRALNNVLYVCYIVYPRGPDSDRQQRSEAGAA